MRVEDVRELEEKVAALEANVKALIEQLEELKAPNAFRPDTKISPSHKLPGLLPPE